MESLFAFASSIVRLIVCLFGLKLSVRCHLLDFLSRLAVIVVIVETIDIDNQSNTIFGLLYRMGLDGDGVCTHTTYPFLLKIGPVGLSVCLCSNSLLTTASHSYQKLVGLVLW